jgi:lipoprotein-releasing system permease protein
MFNSFILRLAFRYFSAKKANRLVSFISGFSLMGVTLGVAALIVVMAVMEGFHVELTKNMIGIGGDINITPASKEKIDDYPELVDRVKTINGVNYAIPQVQEKALAISGADSFGVIIKGFKSSDLDKKRVIIDNQISGSVSDIFDGYKIAIGRELAFNLRINVGDELSLISPGKVATILGNLPRKKTFKVASIFSSNLYDYDSSTIIMSMESAQKMFSYNEDEVNLVEIYSSDPQIADIKTSEIRTFLGRKYFVNSWYDTNAQFLNALKVERVAMFTILSLIIIVAGFNIISSLFMLVNEKRKDIAILKTIGASKSQILAIFIINGSIIGFIGTFLGVTLGILIANNIENIRIFLENIANIKIFEAAIYFLYHLPSKVEYSNVIYVSVMSISISIIATIYPAYKAAALDPAEAIRNE